MAEGLEVGAVVRWRHVMRGGYGYEEQVPGMVAAIGPQRVQIRVRVRDGREVNRWVKAEHLMRPERGKEG